VPLPEPRHVRSRSVSARRVVRRGRKSSARDPAARVGSDLASTRLTMWRTDTYWFDVTVVMTFLMLGQLFLGRFSEYQPRSRRLLKSTVGTALLVGVAVWAGRGWMWALLGVTLGGIVVVHGWVLPRKGVNGWTMEPRERYH